MSKFEIGDTIVCIKEYETLKPGNYYSIKGAGNLYLNADTNKNGFGYCVEDTNVSSRIYKNTTRMYGQSYIHYYFTEEEIKEYFISQDDNYKIYLRDIKINEIINI
jgi:hypothetical protein